jgi:pantothenate kinase
MYSHVSFKAALEAKQGLVPKLWFPDTYDFHEYLKLLKIVTEYKGLVSPTTYIRYKVLDDHGLRLACWAYGQAVPNFTDIGEQQ